MRILVVNWLDPENPEAGGAEVHLFAILTRLAARGHQVMVIVSGWPGARTPEAMVQGIPVRRVGSRYSFALYAWAAVHRALAAGAYDVVVEDINKLPLHLPLITRRPLYAIIPHLFGATAFAEATWPVALAVWLAEQPIPLVYRRAAFHAISGSTRDDLVARGIAPGRVRVIHPGVEHGWYMPSPESRRCEVPTFLYVGRLKRYKGLDTALRAVARARAQGCQARLEFAGTGDDRARLERTVARLGLGDAVWFHGFVTEAEKRELLRRAWAVVLPSAKEGWGLSTVEGAACGTPAVATNRPGLRDTVVDGQTGFLVSYGDVEALAAALVRLASDRGVVETLGAEARRFAETFSWDRAADETEAHLLETVEAARGSRGG